MTAEVAAPVLRTARLRRASADSPAATGEATADLSLAERFDRDGFVVLEDVLSAPELDELRAEALAIFRGERGDVQGVNHSAGDDSASELMRRYLCIHFPHKISSAVAALARHAPIVKALTSIIGPNVKMMQSMFFIKAEGKAGQAWHQDENFIPTRDRSLAAAWIAVDDATVENGCLWVIPGSHRRGVLYPDREIDDERFDCSWEAYDFEYTDADAVPVEVKAGSAVLFDGYLLHRSLPNSGLHGMRRALVFHYMSAESLLPWVRPEGKDDMARADHRDVMLVAGRDPYAFRGTTDVFVPRVRAERDGGCVRGVRT